MDTLLYLLARAVIGFVQSLPLGVVARLGRAGGGLAYWLDGRHRRMARANMRRFLDPKLSDDDITKIAKENFKRIGENFACAVKTAGMSGAEIREILTLEGGEKYCKKKDAAPPRSAVFAVGHFGNFELYARTGEFVPSIRMATTYRGLKQPSLNRLLQSLRAKSGCLFFERRTQNQELKEAMSKPGLNLGLLADQHAGDRGLKLPFFGEDCSTSAAPAVFALRYDAPLYTAICYRVALGKWRVELGAEIPTHENGRQREVTAIMLDVNKAFEAAVRRDPANWFWVHNRWKANKYRQNTASVKNSLSETTDDEHTPTPSA